MAHKRALKRFSIGDNAEGSPLIGQATITIQALDFTRKTPQGLLRQAISSL
jgi:hypothetical protein